MIFSFFPKYSSNVISPSQFLSSFHFEPHIKSQLRLYLHKALSIVLLKYDKAPVLPKQENLQLTPLFPFQWALKAHQTPEFMHTSTSKAQHLSQLLQNFMLFRAQHGDDTVLDIYSLQSNLHQTKLALLQTTVTSRFSYLLPASSLTEKTRVPLEISAGYSQKIWQLRGM